MSALTEAREALAQAKCARAVTLLERAFVSFQEAGDRPREAMALLELGRAYSSSGSDDQALICFDEASRAGSEAADRDASALLTAGQALEAAALLRHREGLFEEAIGCFEQAVDAFHRGGDAEGRSRSQDALLASFRKVVSLRGRRDGRGGDGAPAKASSRAGSGSGRLSVDVVRLERERKLATKLVAIGQSLASELDLGRLLEGILDGAVALLSAERSFLIFTAQAPESFRAALGLTTPLTTGPASDDDAGGSRLPPGCSMALARNFDREVLQRPEFKVSRSVIERVLETNEPILARDARSDPLLGDKTSVAALGLRSLVAVPVRLKSSLVGVLYLDNRFGEGAFAEADVPLIEAFANQAAVALANASLCSELQQRDQELRQERARVEMLNNRLRTDLHVRSKWLDSYRSELETLERASDEMPAASPTATRQFTDELVITRGQVPDTPRFSGIIGSSPPMQRVFKLVERVRTSDVPVLIQGESGTGKELVAKAIHDGGNRKQQRFVSENCAAIADTLLESELFGHEAGSFTGATKQSQGLFEVASGGTLFLDEVGEMSPACQAKLLRVLEEGEIRRVGGNESLHVDVRILSATNRDLRAMSGQGNFREDLYYRLNVVRVVLPPLRERGADLELLVCSLTHRALELAGESATPRVIFSPAALRTMAGYRWPGNVRELENEIRRLVAMGIDLVEPGHLSDSLHAPPPPVSLQGADTTPQAWQPQAPTGAAAGGMPKTLEDAERQTIENALASAGGNKARAAEILGIPRTSLYHKLRRYGLSSKQSSDPDA